MKKVTTSGKTFREVYDSLPPRQTVKAPKQAFIDRIAAKTMKSEKTVRCWLSGAQKPDALTKSIIEKDLGCSGDVLFPSIEE